jgi:hypothetical protein
MPVFLELLDSFEPDDATSDRVPDDLGSIAASSDP